MIIGSDRDTDAGTTAYTLADGLSTATETDRSIPWPAPGAFSTLHVATDTAPGASESYTLTLRKNAADQALTVSIANTDTTGSDTSNSFTCVAGDLIAMKIVASGSAAANAIIRWGFRFYP